MIFDRERIQPLAAYFQDCSIVDGNGFGNGVYSGDLNGETL